MISVYKIKPAFQRLLNPLMDTLHGWGVSPNMLSILAIIWSGFIGYLFTLHDQFPAVLLVFAFGLLLRMALNAMDGMMARKYELQSKTGELINEFGDVLSDILIIIPFVFVPGINQKLVLVFALLSVLNEFAGLLGKAAGKERRYDGPMGKSDRALVLGLFCIVYFYWSEASEYGTIVFAISSVLVIFSTLVRLYKASK